MKYDFDCLIIGAGIAGMTAAIYLKRANVNFMIIDKDAPGGLLNKINLIENYPGIKSITGPDLAYNLYEQLSNLGIEIKYGNVLKIEEHTIKTDIATITAKTIIIATGRSAKKLNKTNNKNISYCAVCDGNLYKDKCVAVIGNDKSTIDDVLYLSNICNKVIMVTSSNIDYKFDKKNITIEKIESLSNVIPNDTFVKSININNKKYNVDGIFISLGYEPQINFLDNIEIENGYITVNNRMQTNKKYIYACGDIIKKDVYQLTTAASDATIAAINIKKDLIKCEL